MKKYIIVGGGASGLVAAINLKRQNNDVIILEKNDKCGKKILATGNGHCNYFNSNQKIEKYHSNSNLIEELINENNINKVLDFFDSIGIVPRIKDGYYYPYSNSAITIQNTLVEECKRLGVEIIYNTTVESINYNDNIFTIKTNNKEYKTEKLVIASGSNASLKEEVNTYEILKTLGHTIIDIYPALTRINLDFDYLKEWSGIRNNASIKILVNDNIEKIDEGEILYTDNGISGIVTMQLSNIASRNKNTEVVINNMYNFCKTRDEFINLMNERNKLLPSRNISELLDTYMHYKLINCLIKYVGLNPNDKWEKLSDRDKNILASSFVDLRLKVLSTDDISKAQTVSGGVSLDEINLKTMESKKVEGLYILGEAIDLYGDCGGYNLTIAWLTGLLVK